jgi:hypothetical protein
MPADHDRKQDQAAFRRLEGWIKAKYPAGRFVAIWGGKVVAEAADIPQIKSALTVLSIDPRQALVVQAGMDYHEDVTFFAQSGIQE